MTAGLALPVAIALQLGARPAVPPVPSVKAYLSTRDGYVHRFEAAGQDLPTGVHDRALADLERQLRAIVGPVKLPGLAGEGRINLESLVDAVGFGLLDGLRFDWGGDALVVTTRPLLDAYLASDPKLPADLPAIARSPIAYRGFFSSVFAAEAAFEWFGDVPVRPGPGGELAAASLALPTQEWEASPPRALVVVVARRDRVFMVASHLDAPRIVACEAEWKRADEARVAPARGTDDDWRRQEAAFDAYRRCYARSIRELPYFGALTRRAEALVARLRAEPIDAASGR